MVHENANINNKISRSLYMLYQSDETLLRYASLKTLYAALIYP